jgi:hypothetical protein
LKELEMVVAMFKLKYVVDDEDYLFTLNDESEVEVEEWLGMSLLLTRRYVTDMSIDPLLKRLRAAKSWHLQPAEALCRTSIDMVLFERLSAHQEHEALRNLVLQAGKPIVSYLPNPNEAICGDVDYQLGYWTENGQALESVMVVVEAKKDTTLDSGLAQCAAYLGTFTAVAKF